MELPQIRIINHRPINKGCLICSFSICFPAFFEFSLHNCLLMSKESRPWIVFPEEKFINDKGEEKKKWLVTFGNPHNKDWKTLAEQQILGEMQRLGYIPVMPAVNEWKAAKPSLATNAYNAAPCFDDFPIQSECPF